MPDYDTTAAKAESIHNRANEQYAAVRENDRLTPEGKAEQIQSIYDATKGTIERLQDEYTNGVTVTSRQLATDLFGGRRLDGASAQAATAAADRAASINDVEEADRVLRDAMLDGNEFLAKAIARKALDAFLGDDMFGGPWGAVVNTWCEGNRLREEKVQKLVKLRTGGGGVFANAIFLTPTPPEARDSVFSTW